MVGGVFASQRTIHANGTMTLSDSIFERFLAKQGKAIDKWEQYLLVYDAELRRFIEAGRPLSLLEIGVQNGGSLEFWSSLLPAGSTIMGLDIDPRCGDLSFPQGVSVHVADATDPEAVRPLVEGRSFDIIIDDGSHRSTHIIKSFEIFFDHLAPGGKYFVEDLHAAYWPSMDGGFRTAGSAIEFLKDLVDSLNMDHVASADAIDAAELARLKRLGQKIARVAFFDSLAVVERYPQDKLSPFRRLISAEHDSVVPLMTHVHANSADVFGSILFPEHLVQKVNRDLLQEIKVLEAEKLAAEAQSREIARSLGLASVELLRLSGEIDRAYYWSNNRDVADAGADPVEHYYYFGGFEGRNPSANFNTQYYLDSNIDVARAGINPLLHYVLHGRHEGRQPLPPVETAEIG